MPLRILVITLSSGEGELDACKASVVEQTRPPTRHEVISGLGSKEAHSRLYNRIMDARDEYDVFVKLDADMVISRATALEEIEQYFERNTDVDHVVVSVFDHFTGHFIHGIHIFSNRVSWARSDESLFVDPAPAYPGRQVYDPPEIPPFVDHAPDPSNFQAFHFGFHRALKAYQPRQSQRRLVGAISNMQVLRRLRRRYEETRSRRLGLALLAAELVRRGVLSKTSGDKGDPHLVSAFMEAAQLDAEQLRSRLQRTRQEAVIQDVRWCLALLPSAVVSAASRRISEAIRAGMR